MRVALVGMPWFWAHMPSIQLAIVKDIFARSGVESDVFEFYADFADQFGIDLYGNIANTGTFLGERLFSQFYFDELRREPLDSIPHLAFDEPEIEQHILRFGTPLVDHFLDSCIAERNWSEYDAVCLTLTAQQVGASMAFAKRLRSRHPDVPIIVGGAGCAGEMGGAVLEICSEFDIAVHGEAESIIPELVAMLRGERGLDGIHGISWRRADGAVVTSDVTEMHAFGRPRGALNFDAYFERVKSLHHLGRLPSWIPFESSRGCWYGEKSQCTFCGLNEIIKYRQRDTSRLFEELDEYEKKYGKTNFFAVDLIMPRTFFADFLPQVIASDKNWTIFYEVKSNMRRAEVEMLGQAGVRWIQPGIESLDDHVLKLMRKGVSTAHNIQALRLSAEMGITVSWNLISNFPQETPEDYHGMAAFFRDLHHLDPPSGLAPFEVHRFSPFHEEPERHGVRLCGPHKKYEAVFPVDPALLQRLVYRFEYQLLRPNSPDMVAAHDAVRDAVAAWKRAAARKARFEIEELADRSARLTDSRASDEARVWTVPAEEAALIAFLDEMRPLVRLASDFALAEPGAHASLGGDDGVMAAVERLCEGGIVLRISGMALALPTRKRSADLPPARSLRELAEVVS